MKGAFEFAEETAKLALEQLTVFHKKTQTKSSMQSFRANDRIAELDSIIALLNSIKHQFKAIRHDK